MRFGNNALTIIPILRMKILLHLFIYIPLISFSQNKYQYKNIVLEGGGIRGLAYPGALQVLEQKGIIDNIENVCGTSAGAIMGLMIALNYNSHEIDSIFSALKIQQFNDGSVFGIYRRVKKEYGIFKGDKFEEWLSKIILAKTGNAEITFSQLHQLHLTNKIFKDLYCTGTNVTQQKLQILSWQHSPQMKLKAAVHISGCIPVYYKPVAIDSNWQEISVKKKLKNIDLYVDGGMVNNYPVNIFDTCLTGADPLTCEDVKYNVQTLGLKLERPEQIQQFSKGIADLAAYSINSLNDYKLALINLTQETLQRKTSTLKNEKGRTIYISYGNTFGKIRKVSSAEKKELFNNGVKAAELFFNNSNRK